jgi:glutathione synthase/RimK-type ligase-like ATP-grasp enzyme
VSRHDVLILSSPEDVHYRAVDWALRRIGLRSALLYGNCFPRDETQTLVLDSDGPSYSGLGPGGETIDLLEPPVVWYRRGHWPILSEDLDEADRAAAAREADMFVAGARSLAAMGQRWINHPDRDLVANMKPYQLEVARRAGLRVPRTIMSNDPERIRAFFEQAPGEVVLKPFHAMQWQGDDGEHMLFAKKLRFEEIADPEALRLTSHIFQEYVEKRYELRVFCFGDRVLPFKLHTQELDETKTDWRVSTNGALRPEPYPELPEAIRASILAYMRDMGLEYGAFDFIVDSAGDYVFLECNVSGQFLFIESWNPQIPMLAEFVRFLTSSLELTPDSKRQIDELRYADFRRSAESAAYYDAMVASYGRRFVSRNLHRENAPA